VIRLQKFLADAGVASRRAAEKLILEGQVAVNGRTVTELGRKVDPVSDSVEVEGNRVRPRRKIYIALHKPPRYLSTRSDPLSRRTVLDLIPPDWSRVYPVGRLDYDSEGLLFLTNDGDFALRLTHPRYGVRKLYEALIEGRVDRRVLKRIVSGVESEGETLRATAARVLSWNETHTLVEIELTEGKNREVRRLFSACGLEVVRLVRTRVGPIRLGELRSGKWRALTENEIESLLAAT
jgi:23S rRNA pseudouridine2605 synthase